MMMMDESASKEVCASGRPVRNRSYTPFLLPAGRESYGFKAVPSPDPGPCVLQIEPRQFQISEFSTSKGKKILGLHRQPADAQHASLDSARRTAHGPSPRLAPSTHPARQSTLPHTTKPTHPHPHLAHQSLGSRSAAPLTLRPPNPHTHTHT